MNKAAETSLAILRQAPFQGAVTRAREVDERRRLEKVPCFFQQPSPTTRGTEGLLLCPPQAVIAATHSGVWYGIVAWAAPASSGLIVE